MGITCFKQLNVVWGVRALLLPLSVFSAKISYICVL